MALYISNIEITNIRCFDHLKLDFSKNGDIKLWTTILGDNATGKTTLLKSIALGLCDQSSAAGLLRESDQGYIRRKKTKQSGSIIISLFDKNEPKSDYSISTTIKKIRHHNTIFETLKQETQPVDFPWNNLFVCAYGIGRGISGTGDIAGYTSISAVYNLFNYSEGLQNPELVIRRAGKRFFEDQIRPFLKQILHLDEGDNIHLRPNGIMIDGPWGKEMPLRDLADGYRSTFQWVIDFIGWSIEHAVRSKSKLDPNGIVLVDALEEHLHPKWQKEIVSDLRATFPNIQFITTTHSPLVASSVGEMAGEKHLEQLFHLEFEEGKVQLSKHAESVRGLSYDQILASRNFDYLMSGDPRVEKLLKEASILASKGKERDQEEEKKYVGILKVLKGILATGRTLIERDAESSLNLELSKRIDELEKKLFPE